MVSMLLGPVGLVLMPLGHPGGGLEGETCQGSFSSVVMWMQVLAHSLSSSPLEGGLGGAGFNVNWALAWSIGLT